jgi:hypothetical protein
MRHLHTDSVENKESDIILNWITLHNEREIEHILRPGLLRQNYLGDVLVWEWISQRAVRY